MGEKMTQTVADLLDELASVSAMIGYATSGAERNNHKAMRDKIKAEILAHLTQPAQAVDVGALRANCRQRLAHEGKPYPRSSCAVCGKWAPNLERCNDKLAAALPNASGEEG